MTAPLPADPVELARIAYLGLDPERVPRSKPYKNAAPLDRCSAFAYGCGRCPEPAAWIRVTGRGRRRGGPPTRWWHSSRCHMHALVEKKRPDGRESYWQEVGK